MSGACPIDAKKHDRISLMPESAAAVIFENKCNRAGILA